MPASFDLEALKAQAIASRTYVVSRNLKVDDSIKTQVYQSDEKFRNKWGEEYEFYISKIRDAVYGTNGLIMKYDGEVVRSLFFSCSNGHTANSKEYYTSQFPYLKSVKSEYDEVVCKDFEKMVEIEKDKITSKLCSWEIEVLSWYDSGYVKEVRVGDKNMSGKAVREALNLRSSCFEVLTKRHTIAFITYGNGHGVGMSQYGAQGMALHDYSYDEILKHYYQGVDIVSIYE
jgi:stage II sporulation protein D